MTGTSPRLKWSLSEMFQDSRVVSTVSLTVLWQSVARRCKYLSPRLSRGCREMLSNLIYVRGAHRQSEICVNSSFWASGFYLMVPGLSAAKCMFCLHVHSRDSLLCVSHSSWSKVTWGAFRRRVCRRTLPGEICQRICLAKLAGETCWRNLPAKAAGKICSGICRRNFLAKKLW